AGAIGVSLGSAGHRRRGLPVPAFRSYQAQPATSVSRTTAPSQRLRRDAGGAQTGQAQGKFSRGWMISNAWNRKLPCGQRGSCLTITRPNTAMTLADFTGPGLIVPHLRGRNVASVIQELSQAM